MDISFIIPAYNVSRTIRRAIDSVLEQKDNGLSYEIIIVNDGSYDNLDEVIDNYGDKVSYYKKENGGLSDARNYGVNKANGNYLIFIDGDDYIADTLLQDIEEFVKKDVDLIKWNPRIVDNNGIEYNSPKPNRFFSTTGEKGFNRLFGKDHLLVCTWNYAIKKEIIIDFPVGKYHEDFATTPIMMLNATSMIIMDKYEYFYVQTDNSIMRGNDEEKQRKRLEDILYHFDNLIEKTREMDIQRITKENVGIFATNALLVNIKDLKGDNKKYFIRELKKRRISRYIKARNIKQLVKKVLIFIKYR